MKKILISIFCFLATIILIQCTPKLSKEIKSNSTTSTNEISIDTVQVYSEEELQLGKSLMEANCGRCHVLFEPIDFKANEWEEILLSMIPKSKLTGKEAELVKHYILKNAKK